ncbi:hypothetical protein HGRIS_007650 [Hohenbuehelia grisea]|uniref:Copper acquisition factor BIM1-like domain-containing protein n=1 Tax=Hohenbuehelia grisea TaxID=104357 RepID=A0ABR3J697_9AGAR
MIFASYLVAAGFAAVVNAHFQLQFPAPRGRFVEDNEPKFCDGFTSPVSNRTQFPLTGGFFTLNSEHPKWTATALISTSQNPTTFQDFTQALPFFQLTGEGLFCIPLEFSNSNVTGLTAGQNVTLQIEFNGGDGSLFQASLPRNIFSL